MLTEALKFLTDLGNLAAGPQSLNLHGDRHNSRIWDPESHSLQVVPHDPPPRKHNAETIHALTAFALAYRESLDETNQAAAVCWLTPTKAEIILDNLDHREDSIAFELPIASQFATLRNLEESQPTFEPKTLARLIRLSLGLPDHPLINQIARVDWETSRRTQSVVERGKESLGSEINAKVSTTEEIPQEVRLTVPVYEDHLAPEQTIRCLVEIDAGAGQIGIIPPPGECRRAQDAALAFINGSLSNTLEDQITVYRGTP